MTLRLACACAAVLLAAGCGSSSATLHCDPCASDRDCIRGGETCHLGICVPGGEDPRRCPNAQLSSSGSSGGSGSSGSSSGASTTGAGTTGPATNGGSGSTGGATTGGTTGRVLGFGTSPRVAAGDNPTGLAAADFNGDGIQDLAVIDRLDGGQPGRVTVLRGFGDGGFTPLTQLRCGTEPYGIVAGDLDGDLRPDLAVVSLTDPLLQLYANLGDGGFSDGGGYVLPGGAKAVALGDLGGDRLPEIVTANWEVNSLSIFTRSWSGLYTMATFTKTLSGPRGLAIADLDRDGRLDVIVANDLNGTVSTFFGDGFGGFRDRVPVYPVGSDDKAVAAADLDRDGWPEVVTANTGDNTLSVLVNLRDGGLASGPVLGTQGAPYSVVARDLNGDGYPEVATSCASAGKVLVFAGQADGGFGDYSQVYSVGGDTQQVIAADFTRDGWLDLAAVSASTDGVTLLINR